MLTHTRFYRNFTVVCASILLLAFCAVPAWAVTITPAGAVGSSEYSFAGSTQAAVRTIDSSGLTAGLHDTDWTKMWMSNQEASPTIQYNLGGLYKLDGMHLWNYNQVTGDILTNRGFKSADIWVSATGAGTPATNPAAWTRIADNMEFARATGREDYAGQDYSLASENFVQHVLFNDVVNFGGLYSDYTGLSEIRFSGTEIPEPVSLVVLGVLGPAVLFMKRRNAKRSS